VLYEMLTGRPPLRGATALETLEQVRSQEPVRPSQLQPGLPPDLCTVCLTCLHKDPRRRYASAADLAEDLRRFQAGKPITARPVRVPERAWRWCRRNPLWALTLAAVAGLLMFVAVGASLLSLRLSSALDRAQDAERQTQTQLFDAKLAQARALQLSGRSGQRFESLELLQQATDLARRLDILQERRGELRNATLSALALPDLYPVQTWEGFPPGSMHVYFRRPAGALRPHRRPRQLQRSPRGGRRRSRLPAELQPGTAGDRGSAESRRPFSPSP
jgi:hypothetical protein